MKFNFNKIFLPVLSLILLCIVFNMIHYLASEKYIIECFTNNIIQESSETSHTVNLPLNTTYSCSNFCGPNSRCAITGQQCFADIDCPGCKPYSPPLKSQSSECVPGDNDAGKLTAGLTPDYSSLTSGYGTKERIITKDLYEQPAQPNFGYDTWGDTFNEGQKLFNKRYKTNQLPYMPNYPTMYSLTGEFVTDGPLPSNY
jgi:hypothetical protein